MVARPASGRHGDSGARRFAGFAGVCPLLLALLACGPSGTEVERSDAASTDGAASPPAVDAPDGAPGQDAAAGEAEPATSDPAAFNLPRGRALRAGFLVVDGVYNTELMAPWDVLHHTRSHAEPGIEVVAISPDGREVTSFEGLRITPHHGFADAPPLDILVVPSAEHSMDEDLENVELIAWVRDAGRRASFVVSLCEGAFVLAEAGLLDGRAVTTFPGDYQRLLDRFPVLDLRVNVSFVHDGPVLTSEGGARSYDVAMYLVDLLYGPEVAQRVGRGLLVPWPPDPDTRARFVSDPAFRRTWAEHEAREAR